MAEIYAKMSPKGCCSMCADPLDMDDSEEIEWLGPTTAVCGPCYKTNGHILNTMCVMG